MWSEWICSQTYQYFCQLTIVTWCKPHRKTFRTRGVQNTGEGVDSEFCFQWVMGLQRRELLEKFAWLELPDSNAAWQHGLLAVKTEAYELSTPCSRGKFMGWLFTFVKKPQPKPNQDEGNTRSLRFPFSLVIVTKARVWRDWGLTWAGVRAGGTLL